jgi:hypothetical protein
MARLLAEIESLADGDASIPSGTAIQPGATT